jgi:hypothetical protein
VAERALTSSKLRRSWWSQLDRPAKHLDAIVEMLAVANVISDHSLTYEKAGLGVAHQTIDWFLKTKENGDFLLEVKNRPGQAAQEMMRIQTTRASGTHSVLGEPITDFEVLFKSTSSKFKPLSDSSCIQGVILFLGIKVPATRLDAFFHDRLQANLHFIALGKEDKETGTCVNLLGASPEIAELVLSTFGWREGADLTY